MLDTTEQFPRENISYLNNASVSRMPKVCIDAMDEFAARYNALGPDSEASADLIRDISSEVRNMVSGILHCQPDEIVLTQSVTDGINMVAGGLHVSSRHNIVMRDPRYEHHANVFAWLRADAEKRYLAVDHDGLFDMEQLERSVDEYTSVVTLSHVLYNTGAILPLEQVGDMLEVPFFVDAAQSVGRIGNYDYSSLKCDYMAFNGSKWLCGPMGTGLFYCSRKAAESLRPIMVGGDSAMTYDDNKLAHKAIPDRFQAGYRNFAGLAGLAASLRYVTGIGLDRIRRRADTLCDTLREGLEDMRHISVHQPPQNGIGIVSLNVGGVDPAEVVKRLEREGIVLALREIGPDKMVRISPHFYNTESEIQAVLDAIKRIPALL